MILFSCHQARWAVTNGPVRRALLVSSKATGRGTKTRPLSTLRTRSHSLPPFSINDHDNEKDSRTSSSQNLFGGLHLQRRQYHATAKQEILAPFLPEMILAVIVGGGWFVYRTSQGKPLTPDEALEAQEAYRQQQEQLAQRQGQHVSSTSQRQFSTSSKQQQQGE